MSEYQRKFLEDELKNEILNEKCKMIENTETLSELSRTIDDLNSNNCGISTTNFGQYSNLNFKQMDKSLGDFENHTSKIEENDNTANELSGLMEEEDKKLDLNS